MIRSAAIPIEITPKTRYWIGAAQVSCVTRSSWRRLAEDQRELESGSDHLSAAEMDLAFHGTSLVFDDNGLGRYPNKLHTRLDHLHFHPARSANRKIRQSHDTCVAHSACT